MKYLILILSILLFSCSKDNELKPYDYLYGIDSATFIIEKIETHVIIEHWGNGIISSYTTKIPAYRPADHEYIWGRRFTVYTRIDNKLTYSGWDYVTEVNYTVKDSLFQNFIQINNP